MAQASRRLSRNASLAVRLIIQHVPDTGSPTQGDTAGQPSIIRWKPESPRGVENGLWVGSGRFAGGGDHTQP